MKIILGVTILLNIVAGFTLVLLLKNRQSTPITFISPVPSGAILSATTSTHSLSLHKLQPTTGIYVGAYPDFGATEDQVTPARLNEFLALTNQPLVWAQFSQNWYLGLAFPQAEVTLLQQQNITPYIRLMPRDFKNTQNNADYQLADILSGTFDAQLTQWARQAKEYNHPLIIDFAPEPNGDWFTWSGQYNGAGDTTQYGDPRLPDGPERYRDAYRHIINIFNQQQATNCTWIFHLNAYPAPAKSWNTMAVYYPGDDYIDWIGLSVYGPQTKHAPWKTFQEVLEPAYQELTSLSQKPLAILEFGIIDHHPQGDKSQWINDALQLIKSPQYSRIKAISYWHESWTAPDETISLRLDSSQKSLDTYNQLMKDGIWVHSNPKSIE